MFDEDDEFDSVSMIDEAIMHQKGSREELDLFKQLLRALELMKDDSFELNGCEICQGVIRFVIATNYPKPLPEKIALLFFNADLAFNLSFQETDDLAFLGKELFQFDFRKKIRNNSKKYEF